MISERDPGISSTTSLEDPSLGDVGPDDCCCINLGLFISDIGDTGGDCLAATKASNPFSLSAIPSNADGICGNISGITVRGF
jgi:hypothetical protein